MNFSIEESKENDLIIKVATGNIRTRTIRNLLFSLTLQAVRINNQGALLLGLAKSIYYSSITSLNKNGFVFLPLQQLAHFVKSFLDFAGIIDIRATTLNLVFMSQ